jgi:vacuolar-type H+-ATPase subunit E/Vma4
MENLAERIRSDTRKEVQNIGHEAEMRASALESATKARAEELYAREVAALRGRLAMAASGECSSRDSELRREFLRERESLLDGLRSGLENWLATLPAEEEKRLLAELLEMARREIADGTVELSAKTRRLIGEAAGLQFKVDDSLSGGFRLGSSDGRRMADMTYASLVRDFWERRRAEAAAALFEDAGGDGK